MGTIATVVCDTSKVTKMLCKKEVWVLIFMFRTLQCKQAGEMGEQPALRHYKAGKFNKDYNRALTVTSFVNFMNDPDGDIPWSEVPAAENVVHLTDATFDKVSAACSLASAQLWVWQFIAQKKPTLVMFYAPW